MTVVDPPSATEPAEPPAPVEAAPGRGGAVLVAAGILSSRLIGLVRTAVLGQYFGAGPHADVLTVAMRAPNFLQNLLGEGTLSAAFIPIYSRLLHEGRREEAGRFAGAIFGLLFATAGALALLGVLLARPITAVLTPGFTGDEGAVDRFELTVQAVRIIFPMTMFLVLSAWALGVLNSHRRFFLPYFAPVLWNVAIIAALVWAGGWGTGGHPSLAALNRLLFAACWGALAGGVLQLLVQLPTALRLLRSFRPSLSPRVPGVKEALGAFGPVLAGRGVVQLAGYLDLFLASFLAAGATSALGYAQTLYMLPISLFAMSVAASELPELSRMGRADAGRARELLERVRRSLRQMAVLNVPTFVGYLAFGYLIIGLLLPAGEASALEDNWLVYLVLCGYTLGLLASTSSRLLQNTFYALGETSTPARIAMLRVAVSASLGAALMLSARPLLRGRSGASGAATPSASRSTSARWGSPWPRAWEPGWSCSLLRRSLASRVEGAVLPAGAMAKMIGLALAAAVPAGLAGWWLRGLSLAPRAVLVVGLYAALYLLLARLFMPEELEVWIGRFGRRFRRR